MNKKNNAIEKATNTFVGMVVSAAMIAGFVFIGNLSAQAQEQHNEQPVSYANCEANTGYYRGFLEMQESRDENKYRDKAILQTTTFYKGWVSGDALVSDNEAWVGKECKVYAINYAGGCGKLIRSGIIKNDWGYTDRLQDGSDYINVLFESDEELAKWNTEYTHGMLYFYIEE